MTDPNSLLAEADAYEAGAPCLPLAELVPALAAALRQSRAELESWQKGHEILNHSLGTSHDEVERLHTKLGLCRQRYQRTIEDRDEEVKKRWALRRERNQLRTELAAAKADLAVFRSVNHKEALDTLAAARAELAGLDQLKMELRTAIECVQYARAERDQARGEVVRLTKVLEWYASPQNHALLSGSDYQMYATRTMVEHDNGDRARQALQADQAESNGEGEKIPATSKHDAGAYGRCSYCGRYSDDPNILGWKHHEPCDCGKTHGYSGSFEPPGPDAVWNKRSPSTDASQEE